MHALLQSLFSLRLVASFLLIGGELIQAVWSLMLLLHVFSSLASFIHLQPSNFFTIGCLKLGFKQGSHTAFICSVPFCFSCSLFVEESRLLRDMSLQEYGRELSIIKVERAAQGSTGRMMARLSGHPSAGQRQGVKACPEPAGETRVTEWRVHFCDP